MANRFIFSWMPHRGEIYRLAMWGKVTEVVVEEVRGNRVHFTTLGYGRSGNLGLSEFKQNSYLVEARLYRLRRACEKYGLKKTDKLLERQLLG